MLLAVDLGNTNVVMGLYEQEELVQTFRVATVRSRTEDEYAVLLQQLLSLRQLTSRAVSAAIIASVVPQLTDVMVSAIRQALEAGEAPAEQATVEVALELAPHERWQRRSLEARRHRRMVIAW